MRPAWWHRACPLCRVVAGGEGGRTWLGQANEPLAIAGRQQHLSPPLAAASPILPGRGGKGLDSLPCRSEREAGPDAELDEETQASAVPPVLAGQQEPGGPRVGHFSDLQQKSLSFLQALKVCPTPTVSL